MYQLHHRPLLTNVNKFTLLLKVTEYWAFKFMNTSLSVTNGLEIIVKNAGIIISVFVLLFNTIAKHFEKLVFCREST